jgi:hypothetical protein
VLSWAALTVPRRHGEDQKEDTVHAPRVGRLTTALAEVRQAIKAFGWRFRHRFSRPQETDEDPILAMLASLPVDDEPVTDDDRRHIDEGWQAFRDGQVVSAEEVRRGCLDAEGETRRIAKRRAAAV